MTFQSFDTRGNATRRLRFALAASLLLHLLLLWPTGPRILIKDGPALLHAALRTAPPSSASPPPKPAPPRAASPAPTAASAPAPEKSEPRILESSGPVSVPQPSPLVAEKPTPPPPAAAIAAAAPSGAAGGTAALSEASASGAALDGLRGYRLAVASQARRFKRYPPRATASGWEGSAEIRLEVASDGQPRAAIVQRSSGHELLDQAALAMIDAGAQRARLPENLRGKAFAVVLPVVFNLEER